METPSVTRLTAFPGEASVSPLQALRLVRRVTELIGDTPTLELATRIPGWRLLLKLEKGNPGQSMKDRMALSMVDDAERTGRLRSGGTIVESSSGNTGAGLAIVAAERGYRLVVVVDHHAAREKLRLMRAYGAEVVEIDGRGLAEDEVATLAREARARDLASEIPGAVYLEQAHNPANARGYAPLANELLAVSDARIDLLVGSVGTGGSLCGTARVLKATLPKLSVVGVEPRGSIIFGGEPAPYYQSGTGTPRGLAVGENVDFQLIDEGRKVSDSVAFETTRFLARRCGLLVGGAAGGVLHEALAVMTARPAGGTAVAILADGGEKYLDTVFDDAWMAQRGLLDPAVAAELAALIPRPG